jgi:ribonuclease BN (tRNA processing enzyme)
VTLTRRSLVIGASTLLAAPPAFAQRKGENVRLILLGTRGGPRVSPNRSNPANVLMIDDAAYVIDCGIGVTRQLAAAKISLNALRYIFLSHHHSDHILEYGNLFYTAWASGLAGPVHAFGPPGIEEMTRDYFRLNHIDIETRMADEGRRDPKALLIAKDVGQDGVVIENDQVRVTAFQTPHPPMTDLAYKFETSKGTVVISGDTAFNPKLAEFAKGADVLVHEVIDDKGVDGLVAQVPNADTLKKHLIDSHTTIADVGRIAALADVKTLVLTHFVAGDQNSDEQWSAGVREHFKGKILVGRDLLEIPL